ncbi:DUF5333 domain-containing protein [Yoonia sp. R2331]|uniref:DUF5333 domain-containing protein n=1 Tax=Yoonia sp. R2331 TaxID=3237238 RepID=UPI0034E56BEA
MLKRTLFAASTLAIVTVAGASSAKPALKDVAYVREGIIAAGIAYEISEECGDISARLFRGLSFLNGLKSHARDLGYTEAEIDAYIDDKAEKNRLEGIARARLADLGAVPGNAQSHCTVGRAEIAKGSAIGRLLR